MAQDRLRRVQRIRKVQEQLHKVEEWRLAEVQQHLNGLVQDQHDLITALNSEDALHGLFMDATARRLKSLADRERVAHMAKETQSARVREVGARLGAAERLLDAALKQAQRAEEEKLLADTTERVAAQAPRKIIEG